MLVAQGIAKSYPTRDGALTVLRGVSLSVSSGRSVALLGPSGSGKTTLLHILGTLEPPTTGRVLLEDCDLYRLAPPALARVRNRRIGFVFQDQHLLAQCSVLENVLLPTLAGKAAPDVERRARDLLERVGLSNRLDHRPAELSGGERQRAALARALMNRPALVLADEPTGNLDRCTAERVGELLAELPREHGVMLVVATHSERLARRFDEQHELTDGQLLRR